MKLLVFFSNLPPAEGAQSSRWTAKQNLKHKFSILAKDTSAKQMLFLPLGLDLWPPAGESPFSLPLLLHKPTLHPLTSKIQQSFSTQLHCAAFENYAHKLPIK